MILSLGYRVSVPRCKPNKKTRKCLQHDATNRTVDVSSRCVGMSKRGDAVPQTLVRGLIDYLVCIFLTVNSVCLCRDIRMEINRTYMKESVTRYKKAK